MDTDANTPVAPATEVPNPYADYAVVPIGATMGYEVHDDGAGRLQHNWWIKSDDGGIHIWACLAKLAGWPDEWLGGVEAHYAAVPDSYGGWFDPAKPSHEDCWLLKGPCWHDGSSLYFSEQIAPRMPYAGGTNPHDYAAMPHDFIAWHLLDWFGDKITRLKGAAV